MACLTKCLEIQTYGWADTDNNEHVIDEISGDEVRIESEEKRIITRKDEEGERVQFSSCFIGMSGETSAHCLSKHVAIEFSGEIGRANQSSLRLMMVFEFTDKVWLNLSC